MATAVEHADIVLSAIVPNRPDLLAKAVLKLTEAHFVDEVQRNMFTLLVRYYQSTAQVVPEHYIDDNMKSPDAGKKLLYMETYRAYSERHVGDSEFSFSLERLREMAAHRETIAKLTEAMTITRQGITLDDGTLLQGAEAAREYLTSELSAIDRDLKLQSSPEGDIRDETDSLLDEYAERKRARLEGRTEGILFGISELDTKISMQNGELILVAGYSSDGKSSLSVQAAWSACVEQGKNVLFLTTETLRPQINRKLVARHSKLPMFEIPNGLNTRDLKAGTLPDHLEIKYAEVVEEFGSNPAYGHMYVVQVPRGSSISTIEQTMYRVQRRFNIDLVVMDYLALLRSDKKRGSQREELADIMKEAKQVATTFDDGRGVPFLSPWQVSRLAWENAHKVGMYTTASLSETAEATNSSDVIVSILAPADNTERTAEVTMQVLKNRDGETASGLIVEVDYATSSFRGRGGAKAASSGSLTGGLDSIFD